MLDNLTHVDVWCIVLWLRYTSFPGLFPLLSRGQFPLVKVEEISQTIDAESLTVQNSVQFAGPLASSSISTSAKFEVRSPKRVQVCSLQLYFSSVKTNSEVVLVFHSQYLERNWAYLVHLSFV